MNGPKCRLCGVEHWQKSGCKFGPAFERPSVTAVPCAGCERLRAENARLKAENVALCKQTAANTVANSANSANAANTTDRKAYMRDLMRKKRAEAKAAKAVPQ